MTKLHEVLAAEDTMTKAADKMVHETMEKFSKHGEFFTGAMRTLKRVGGSPEDQAIEQANRRTKELPTTVPETVEYAMNIVAKALDTKLQKHAANQNAGADIVVNGLTLMDNVPVDYLLDLEKQIPKWKEMFAKMPTLDPSKEWKTERTHVYKTDPVMSAQTEKILYPVVLAPATDHHPAQIKESSRDQVMGTYEDIFLSGAVTSQKKADIFALCDALLVGVKEARMRANTQEAPKPAVSSAVVTSLFTNILNG